MKNVCNYSLIRFMPYPDTGEFINLGLALLCPQTGFFDYLLETSKTRRITQFFPELTGHLIAFRKERRAVQSEMDRIHKLLQRAGEGMRLDLEAEQANQVFAGLLHAREGVFHYSPIRTVMADHPAECLQDLFHYYVRRNFTFHNDGNEEERIRKSVHDTLVRRELSSYFTRKIYMDEHVKVSLPFVHLREGRSICGIRPLNFDLMETQDIVAKGDRWKSRIDRLRDIPDHPSELLIVTKLPENVHSQRWRVAAEMMEELDLIEGLRCAVDREEEAKVLSFARRFVLAAHD